MELLIKRLVDVGYSFSDAENLYGFYNRMGDLDGLEDYILAKESISESLSEFHI